jgi:hypothetical protein
MTAEIKKNWERYNKLASEKVAVPSDIGKLASIDGELGTIGRHPNRYCRSTHRQPQKVTDQRERCSFSTGLP